MNTYHSLKDRKSHFHFNNHPNALNILNLRDRPYVSFHVHVHVHDRGHAHGHDRRHARGHDRGHARGYDRDYVRGHVLFLGTLTVHFDLTTDPESQSFLR